MDRRLTTVAAFDEPVRANVARNVLEAAGIPVIITDSEIVAMDWLLSNAVGGIKVQVWEEDAERAAELLDREFGSEAGLASGEIDEQELARQALAEEAEGAQEEVNEKIEEPPEPPADEQETMPGETSSAERENYARRFFYAAVFSLLFPPLVIYAVYLFLNAVFGAGSLSPQSERALWIGGAFLLVWIIPASLLLGAILGDPGAY